MPDITSDVQLIMNDVRLFDDPASTPLDDDPASTPLDDPLDEVQANEQQPSSAEQPPDDLFGVTPGMTAEIALRGEKALEKKAGLWGRLAAWRLRLEQDRRELEVEYSLLQKEGKEVATGKAAEGMWAGLAAGLIIGIGSGLCIYFAF